MNRVKFKRMSVSLVVPALLFIFGVTACEQVQYETWTHVVVATNYTDTGNGYSVYRINDDRFNTSDWYEIWMDNSYWDPSAGWGPFDAVWDSTNSRFYFQPLYNDGYVEWNSYTSTDILGATLRFYRTSYPQKNLTGF